MPVKVEINTRHSFTGNAIKSVQFVEEYSFSFKFDEIANVFSLKLYYDPNDPISKEIFAFSHIHECKIYWVHDKPGLYAASEQNGKSVFKTTKDELILTGFMINTMITTSAKPGNMSVGGYSKAGILKDCDFPSDAFPLQTEGLSFRQIVNAKVIPYFSNPNSGGFKFYCRSSRADAVFSSAGEILSLNSKVELFDSSTDDNIGKNVGEEATNIAEYLKELTIQRDFVLSTDIFGNLIVNVPYTGKDYLFEIGTGTNKSIKYIEATINFNGQGIHSQVEILGQQDKFGSDSGYFKLENKYMPFVYRPRVIKYTGSIQNVLFISGLAYNAASTELKNIPLKITLDTPVVNGKFIMPNNTIRVMEPALQMYKPIDWFIEEVSCKGGPEGETCEVTAVPLDAYREGEGNVSNNKFLEDKYRH